jgi:hypothetical protein
MACSRQMSATLAPSSCCLRMEMIWVSVNLEVRIERISCSEILSFQPVRFGGSLHFPGPILLRPVCGSASAHELAPSSIPSVSLGRAGATCGNRTNTSSAYAATRRTGARLSGGSWAGCPACASSLGGPASLQVPCALAAAGSSSRKRRRGRTVLI